MTCNFQKMNKDLLQDFWHFSMKNGLIGIHFHNLHFTKTQANWNLCPKILLNNSNDPNVCARKSYKNVLEMHNHSFLPILWCSHNGNHPQEELAKFGYKSERKVENLKNLVIFLWNAGTFFKIWKIYK